jgi:hypothetical protein
LKENISSVVILLKSQKEKLLPTLFPKQKPVNNILWGHVMRKKNSGVCRSCSVKMSNKIMNNHFQDFGKTALSNTINNDAAKYIMRECHDRLGKLYVTKLLMIRQLTVLRE